MKERLAFFFLFGFFFNTQAMDKNIFDFETKSAKGEEFKLNKYRGKTVLFVNIATRCGYTEQLGDLEKLYKKYEKEGLVVIGIPSNDFGSQTPEKDKDVAKFCKLNYGVSFPLTSKTPVSGKSTPDYMKFILKISGGDAIKWNFEKFLFDKKGSFVSKFSSKVTPLNSKLEKTIKDLL